MNVIAKNVVFALSLGISAGVIFAFGLVAGPLTPSEGHPTPVAWLVFLIVPLLLCLIGTAIAKSWPVKIALLVESVAILMLAAELLRLFGILPG